MMFFARVRPGTTFEFLIIPYSTLFFSFFPSLSLLRLRTVFFAMQVMNFKLKGGLKLLTHVCMQIFPFSRTLHHRRVLHLPSFP